MSKETYYDVPLTEKEMEGILAAIQCAEYARSGTIGVMGYRRQQRIRAMLRKKLGEIK